MGEVTLILSQIEAGDSAAAEHLLPLVYEELRKLAARKMARESADHSLSATALVHEAYIRLVDVEKVASWNGRGHFFAAAAEAMRRILVESARRRQALKRGGNLGRENFEEVGIAAPSASVDLIALDDALHRLAEADQEAADLIKLRFFCRVDGQRSRGSA